MAFKHVLITAQLYSVEGIEDALRQLNEAGNLGYQVVSCAVDRAGPNSQPVYTWTLTKAN